MRLQAILSYAVAAIFALTAAEDLSGQNEAALRRLHGEDGNEDISALDDFDPDSDSAADDTQEEPISTSPSTTIPVVDGVKMFGQCGGVFYTGSTTCADPDAYCKQLSIYSSICSPMPLK